MLARIAADAVVVLHLAFIAFVMLGGLLVLRWRRLALLHVPAFVWAVLIELADWRCPLTSVENRLRAAAGLSGYPGGFVDHYLTPLIYPAGLTRPIQLLLALGVIAVNGAIYGAMLRSKRAA